MKKNCLLLMAFILASVGMKAATQKTAVNLSMDWKVDGTADVTYDSDTKTITWAEGTTGTGLGQFGLSYSVADYDRLVIKVMSSTCGNVRFRMDGTFDVADNGWDCVYVDIPASDEARTFTINLTGNSVVCNQGETNSAFSTIGRMWFNTLDVGNIVIDEIYFEKDVADTPGGSVKTYFSVSDDAFILNFWGDTNTKDETSNAFTLAAYGNSVGWDYYYSGKLDISDYDRLVVKLKSVSDNKVVHFRVTGMADATTEAPGNYSVELTADNNYTATINLADGITTNSDLGENTATAIDLTMINSLRFWAWAGEVTVAIDEIYFEKDGEVPSDITKDETKTSDTDEVHTEVYTVGPKTLTVAVEKTTDEGATSAATHGSITATGAVEGGNMVITLTITPEAKHELDELVVEIMADDSNGDTPGMLLARRWAPDAGKFITPTLQADGTYTFEMPDGNVKVTAKFKKLPPKPVALPAISYNEPDNEVTMTMNDGDDEHEADVRLYYTTDGSDPTTSETRTELTTNGTVEVTANMTVVKVVAADEEGNYSDVVEQEVSRVRYLTVTKEWTAFYSPETFDVPNGLKAYTIKIVTTPEDGASGTVILKEQNVINKNTPMLIENTVIGENTTKFRIENATDQTISSEDMCTEFKGVSANTTLEDNGSAYYVLKDGTFLRCNPGMVYAWNCYLEFPVGSSVAGARSFTIVIDNGQATAIDTDTVGTATVSDGQWFNLNGIRIPQPTIKGIYILNGKKFVIK